MRLAPAAALLLLAAVASADDDTGPAIHGLLDMRAVRTDDTRSWLDGGPGKLRYGPPVGDAAATLLRLAQVSLLVDAPIGALVAVHAQANFDAEGDREVEKARLDLVEAFVAVSPEPSPRVRVRARLGVFFPPISQEADGVAWTGPYTITPSAATSWIAEELRTIGGEVRVALRPEGHELAALGALFGGNDPTGTLLAWRGWALGDRQTAVSDRLPLASIPSIEPGGLFEVAPPWVQPFREIDGRLGYYLGTSYRGLGLDVRALWYDNRAHETSFDGFQYAWDTRFASASSRLKTGPLELLGQYLEGRTLMGRTGDGRPKVDAEFRTAFGMASLSSGRHRLTARYDWFDVMDADDFVAEDPNAEDGRAWTVAYALRTGEAHRLAVEAVRIESDRSVRSDMGLPERVRETQLQASFRVTF